MDSWKVHRISVFNYVIQRAEVSVLVPFRVHTGLQCLVFGLVVCLFVGGLNTWALSLRYGTLITNVCGMRLVRAEMDSRNLPSRKLVESLNFRQVAFKKKADFFKGADSDEYVYELSIQGPERARQC